MGAPKNPIEFWESDLKNPEKRNDIMQNIIINHIQFVNKNRTEDQKCDNI